MLLWLRFKKSNFFPPTVMSNVRTGIVLNDKSTSLSLYGIQGSLGKVFLLMNEILLWLRFSFSNDRQSSSKLCVLLSNLSNLLRERSRFRRETKPRNAPFGMWWMSLLVRFRVSNCKRPSNARTVMLWILLFARLSSNTIGNLPKAAFPRSVMLLSCKSLDFLSWHLQKLFLRIICGKVMLILSSNQLIWILTCKYKYCKLDNELKASQGGLLIPLDPRFKILKVKRWSKFPWDRLSDNLFPDKSRDRRAFIEGQLSTAGKLSNALLEKSKCPKDIGTWKILSNLLFLTVKFLKCTWYR